MTTRSIAIVIHDGVQALDVVGPLDVFAEANGMLAPAARYETALVAARAAPVRASNGMRMLPDIVFTAPDRAFDVVLVAGGPQLPQAPADVALCRWLSLAVGRASLYGSICTGAFALGHAGLLDGRAVTTHWQNAAQLAAAFPHARVDLDRIHIRDGRLITSAGVTAGIDLALALLAEDHGPGIARAVAKRLVVVAQRQGGQSQFSPFLAVPAKPGSPLALVQRHVLEHIAEALSLHRLAAIAGVSARGLSRLFATEARMTPHEFVEAARVDAARNLLEGGTLPLKAVAFDTGFATTERMRLAFLRRLRLTPAQYRASFQKLG